MTQELQQVVDLGKRATARPWVPWHMEATGSNDWADKAMIAGLPVTSVERSAAFWKRDAAYLAAAANSADILAQRLLDIGKLCEEYADDEKWDAGYVRVAREVRKILEGNHDGK